MRVPAGKAADAKAFDKAAKDFGVPSLILVENAAFSLYLEIKEIVSNFKPEKIVVLAGNGGNGSDGFALVRILKDRGCKIPIILIDTLETLSDGRKPVEEVEINNRVVPEAVLRVKNEAEISGRVLFVDALVGIGLKSALNGRVAELADFINEYEKGDKFVLSVDIPSGLNSDNGLASAHTVRADLTVTMGIYKTGLFAQTGPRFCGKIALGKISAVQTETVKTSYFVEEDLIPKFPEIAIDSYKNRLGHLLAIGGDIEKLGAIIVSARSFLASGGGLVTAAFKKDLLPMAAGVMPGMMLIDVEKIEEKIDDFSAMVVGPGLTKFSLKPEILAKFKGVIVADGGMFKILNENRELREAIKNSKVVFTPHQGEIRTYLNSPRDEAWIEQVERFPLEKEHLLIAKSHATFIRTREKTTIVPHGARALSFAGSGDALTGIVAFETFYRGLGEGAINAVVRHRYCGIKLEESYSPFMHDIDKLIEFIGVRGE